MPNLTVNRNSHNCNLRALNDYSRSVTQHFRGRPCSADFRAFVAQSDDSVRSQLASVLKQELVSLLAGLLAHLGICANLPTDDLLQAAEKPLAESRRSHHDAAHHTLVFADAITVKRERRRSLQRLLHPCSRF